MKFSIALAAIFFSTPAWCQDAPPAPDRPSIAVYQIPQLIKGDCAHNLRNGGESAQFIARYCTCYFETMASNITLGEFIEIDGHIRARRGMQTHPAMARIRPQLDQCKGQR